MAASLGLQPQTRAPATRTDQTSRAGPAGRRRSGWRTLVATILIVVGCVLAPVSVLAVWVANQVSDTGRYVANMEPLVHNPAIQNALTDKITTEITTKLNVTATPIRLRPRSPAADCPKSARCSSQWPRRSPARPPEQAHATWNTRGGRPPSRSRRRTRVLSSAEVACVLPLRESQVRCG